MKKELRLCFCQHLKTKEIASTTIVNIFQFAVIKIAFSLKLPDVALQNHGFVFNRR